MKSAGPKSRRGSFVTVVINFAFGLVIGATAGVFIGFIWVSVEWYQAARTPNPPALNWVKYIYMVGAMLFGLVGSALGAIIGGVIGLAN